MSASTPSFGQTPSQRTLAAIVFTDVVSFSARMHTDEVGTLKLLQRDFTEMRRICVAHEGAVLKTTGDGLLLTFTSAVQAVACALAMQRQFAGEAKVAAPGEALQHRVGIHLGDILVQDEDVMGDGVNIASRLQAEAEPGGICISQTVYDVVKNKLEMQAVSLGPRDLKNIAQSMPVYRLLLEAQSLDPAARSLRPTARTVPGAAPGKSRALLIGGIVVVLVVVFAGGILVSRRPATNPPVAPASVPAQSTAGVPAGPAGAAAESDLGPNDLAGDLANEFAKHKDLMAELHTRYLDRYDFNGLVLALRDKAGKPSAPPALQQLLRSAELLVRLKSWLELALGRYTQQRPLRVREFGSDAGKDTSVYLSPDLRIVFLENGTPQPRELVGLKPPQVGAIIVSAIREAKGVQRGILGGAQSFARLYSLPAMTEALASEKARHEREPASR